DRLCNAQRYECSAARRDTRAGHYERGLQTKAGEVRLRVPKLRRQAFETAIIEGYRRRQSSVEEALIEMYLARVSVHRVEDITDAFVGDTGVTLDGVEPEQEDPGFPHAFCPQVEQVNFVLLLGPLRSSGRRALSRSTGPSARRLLRRHGRLEN